MRANDQHFIDWECHALGYGYGTGEEFIIPALKRFMEMAPPCGGSYHHEALEAALGPAVAWLLINLLCRADIIEYGTSPRHGWLTRKGEALKAYLASKSTDELLAVIGDGESCCFPDTCQCEGVNCPNPLWVDALHDEQYSQGREP